MVSPFRHFTSAVTMKAFLALVLLAALGLVAEANLEHFKPRIGVLPVNPKYTAEEWQEIYAAQKLSPEYSRDCKQDNATEVDVPLDDVQQRVCNGNPAAPGQFPWQVALIIDYSFLCSGSLISREWVLTAAHCACIDSSCSGSHYQIGMGSHIWNQFITVMISTTRIVHPRYNEVNLNHDIALIKLPTPVNPTNNIRPIRLRYIEKLLDGKIATISGWGIWGPCCQNPAPPGNLQFADVTVIPHALCAFYYGLDIDCNRLCTYDPETGKTPCHGDSGSALVYQEKDGEYTQVGIASFVSAQGCKAGPAGYTNVIRYLCWIAKHTDLTFCSCLCP